jgi:hypothetical protein
MAERNAIQILAEDLLTLTSGMSQDLKNRDYERAHRNSRAALSLASRLHARLTSVIEAQALIADDNRA